MTGHRWMYPCRVLRVVDGDTVDVEMDLGLRLYRHERIRFDGINAPEVRGHERAAGEAAKLFVATWIDERANKRPVRKWPFLLETTGESGGFGRWAGVLYHETESLHDALLKSGHAVRVER